MSTSTPLSASIGLPPWENVDPSTLWWTLYAEGVLAGTNGLLALSTAMTDADITRVRDVVVGVVQRNRVSAGR